MPVVCSFPNSDLLRKSKKISELGSGTFGSVALYDTPLGEYVVKETKKVNQSAGYPSDFITEIDSLFKFRSISTIIRIDGVCFDSEERRAFILLEPMKTNLRRWFSITEYEKRLEAVPYLISQIGGALAIMHQMSFVHGDIKNNNILVNSGFDFKLADFGKCSYVTDLKANYGAIARYRPYYSENIFYEELYAFCVVLVETLLGENMISIPRGLPDHQEDRIIAQFYRYYGKKPDVKAILKDRLNRKEYKKIPKAFWDYVLPVFQDLNSNATEALVRAGFGVSQETLKKVQAAISVQEKPHPRLSLVQKRASKIIQRTKRSSRYMGLFERLMSKFLSESNIKDEEVKYYGEIALILVLGKYYLNSQVFSDEAQLLLFERTFLEAVKYQSIVLPR